MKWSLEMFGREVGSSSIHLCDQYYVAIFMRGLFNDLETLMIFPYVGFNKAFIAKVIFEFNLAYVETNVTTIFTL